ncbi:MAG: DUF3754 domain-containing protein [Anaerolineaceae bacterium]|nr:DUF3754 domain-containing protein [Anaerolineaceae bacterium]MCB9102028.1 DUF3754 domain-containing protein [Anaerolineales bacterium]
MATYTDREAFIPYRRADLVELCLADGQLPADQAQTFREFCAILAAYYHFEFHQVLEHLKENFAPFNPDADTKSITELSAADLEAKESRLVKTFETVLKRANFNPLSETDLQQAFETASLVELRTKVDFDDFDQMIFYHRGDVFSTTTMKKFFRKVEVEIDIFERVALLLKFKDRAYFEAKKAKLDKLNFTPGKTYIYLYKNIPRHDLEVLFPNVEVSMTWKDRLLLIVPALGAGIGVLFKALPQIILIIGVILFFTLGPQAADDMGANEENVRNIMPVLAALLTLVIALGGFAVKQYTTYKTKQIKFLKDMTDTLFFRNLSNNASVFQALIDAAEEEETKEIILVYYHLLTSPDPLTPAQLDDRIERWMEEKFGAKIDFDIEGPLQNLEQIHGPRPGTDQVEPLLHRDEIERLYLQPLDESKGIIDWVWDNLFQFNEVGVKVEPAEQM